MHWSISKADEAVKWKGDRHVVASGISPSGPIHYGNFREILTADLMHKALGRVEADSELIFIFDDFDPLRKVYPYLDSSYREHVGKPLTMVPDPEGCHGSYAEHYATEFIGCLDTLGINPEIKYASELYKNGDFSKVTAKALDETKKIREILEEETGRELPDGWLPYNPLCSECGRISTTTPHDYKDLKVSYTCECGYQGTAKIEEGEGKLPWRVDWPAKWTVLGVTVEPFGKDHAADGGSYDTGKRISKEVYGYEQPYPIIYEQVGLKGEGEMSSSKGIALTPKRMLEFLPPEIIRYMLVEKPPNRHIEIDTGFGMIQTINNYQKHEQQYYNNELDQEKEQTYELSQPNNQPPKQKPNQIPFKHLVNAVQISNDREGIQKILERTGHWNQEVNQEWIEQWIERAKTWVQEYAPEKAKFQIQKELPPQTDELNQKQAKFLKKLSKKIKNNEYSDQELKNQIYNIFKKHDLQPRQAFASIYIALLGRPSGPRAAWFLLSLDQEFVVNRLEKAAENAEKNV
ncbi:Lysyl-tRNA synthetase class I [Methanonatronarchaeum thermophilum]|uniref:Lysine--tRNA ligase n=1 Tax=Methanonatronarchaeum thermophilum TaxID=1927129 RepID=A0A1Y3GIH1_9EURY|nr:lysine--tRNA ligase [Methanonatronarchaeum thermophilum]OUJ19235.1 Lysyl-tRNA synthetase class I [Methanonatronarchaeum thermophilum]